MEFVLGINQRPNCSTVPHVGHSEEKNRKTRNAFGTLSNLTECREYMGNNMKFVKDIEKTVKYLPPGFTKQFMKNSLQFI